MTFWVPWDNFMWKVIAVWNISKCSPSPLRRQHVLDIQRYITLCTPSLGDEENMCQGSGWSSYVSLDQGRMFIIQLTEWFQHQNTDAERKGSKASAQSLPVTSEHRCLLQFGLLRFASASCLVALLTVWIGPRAKTEADSGHGRPLLVQPKNQLATASKRSSAELSKATYHWHCRCCWAGRDCMDMAATWLW